ncbi:MAG: ribosome maturation factor RimP [Candidatus Methylopumilus sp.]|jgi:ribosome maturation factor RimP|nr:ribosome maturation factor RimP [Betaproteobacteria bacterium]
MEKLETLIEKTVQQLGYELVDLEISNRGKLLRVYIDKPDSVTIDDCTLVSNHLGRLFTVEQDLDYDRLEVSSPGMDRVLKKLADFERFKGERASVKLRMPLEARKNFLGIIDGTEKDTVLLMCEGELYRFALSNIDKARLSPEFKR